MFQTLLAVAGLAVVAAGISCQTDALPTLPEGQTELNVPVAPAKFITVGHGVQNYTCTEGAWASAGAMATLYDFSCLARISENLADAVPEVLYGWPFDKATFADLPTWNHGRVKRDAVMVRTLADALEKRADISAMFAPFWIGFHQFVPSGDASAPLFSFVDSQNDENAYVLLSKLGSLASPDGAENVAFLELAQVEGGLASKVYRTATYLGQPPETCDVEGDELSVPYAAQYWFF